MLDPLFFYILTGCMALVAVAVAAGDFAPSKNKLRTLALPALSALLPTARAGTAMWSGALTTRARV
jgi:hypothetical protein